MNEAKKRKSNLNVLAIYKPAINYESEPEPTMIFYYNNVKEATIDSPFETITEWKGLYINLSEIWVYDITTGEILTKFK
jgi:hypothetical protein